MGGGPIDRGGGLTGVPAKVIAVRRSLRGGLGALLVLAVASGCGEGPESSASQPLPTESLPGVYSGVFPCDGCPGIPSRLWIRADGRFFLEQQYPAAADRDKTAVYSLGRWGFSDDRYRVHLDGSGPRRTFARPDRDTLVMQTPSDLEHRLTRDQATPDFTSIVRMTGLVRRNEGGLTFTECLTGLVLPISRDGDFSRFHHQYRSIGGRRPVLAELEGRFHWSDDGAPRTMTIERFVTLRAGQSCS
ncbi:MAG: copper resistance protein NlpE N-terminal domain-containing protein [Woeseiaceae bacterium]